MDFDWLIIDGYNLLHQDKAFDARRTDLQTARQRLVRRIEHTASEMAPRVTVVFDGREAGSDASLSVAHLDVVFSPANLTADGVIERMVADAQSPERICVITSDRVEEQIVSSAGAVVHSCETFLSRCDASTGPLRRVSRQEKGMKLGDFFPETG